MYSGEVGGKSARNEATWLQDFQRGIGFIAQANVGR